MFNLRDYTKNMLIGLYNDKVYVGARVRELALNYMIKGYLTQDDLMYIDEYIANAEKPAEVTEESADEVIETTEEVTEEPVEVLVEEVTPAQEEVWIW